MNYFAILPCFLLLVNDTPQVFTGFVEYEVSGNPMISNYEFIFGEDFFMEKVSGKIKEVIPGSNDFFVDIRNSKKYSMDYQSSAKTEIVIDREIHRIENLVFDTVDHQSEQFLSVEFDYENLLGESIHSKYYYSLQHILAPQYSNVSRAIGNRHTFFPPLSVNNIPVYIEISGKSRRMTFKLTHLRKFTISRDEVFKELNIDLN